MSSIILWLARSLALMVKIGPLAPTLQYKITFKITHMKFSELPLAVQESLFEAKNRLHLMQVNTAYEILVYNKTGTRYFNARRVQGSWQGNGVYMPFGGGSKWTIKYGEIGFETHRNPFGGIDAELGMGRSFGKSANGTMIPQSVATKQEVLALIAQIGIF